MPVPTERNRVISDACSSVVGLPGRSCIVSLEARTRVFGCRFILLSKGVEAKGSTDVAGPAGWFFWMLLVGTDLSGYCKFALTLPPGLVDS